MRTYHFSVELVQIDQRSGKRRQHSLTNFASAPCTLAIHQRSWAARLEAKQKKSARGLQSSSGIGGFCQWHGSSPTKDGVADLQSWSGASWNLSRPLLTLELWKSQEHCWIREEERYMGKSSSKRDLLVSKMIDIGEKIVRCVVWVL